MVFSVIPRYLKRNKRRSILIFFSSLCFFLLAGIYWENILRTELSLEKLSRSVPVTGQITDISGSRRSGLEISPLTVDQILDSKMVRNPVCTAQAVGNLEKVNQVENPQLFDTSILGCNSLEAFSSLTQEDILFSQGEDVRFLNTQKPLCVISDEYAQLHGLSQGDRVSFPAYSMEYQQGSYQYKEAGSMELTVIGIMPVQKQGDGRFHMLVPIQWLKNHMEAYGNGFSYSSLRFQVKSPMKLNAFKREMEKAGLSEKSPEAQQEVHGGTLEIDDTIFIQSAEKLQETLQTFQRFQAPFFGLLGVLILVITFLILRGRRFELAIASSLGQKKSAIYMQLFFEVECLNFMGTLFGMILLYSLTGLSFWTLWSLFGAFLLLDTVGILLALYLLFHFDIMAMLTKAD